MPEVSEPTPSELEKHMDFHLKEWTMPGVARRLNELAIIGEWYEANKSLIPEPVKLALVLGLRQMNVNNSIV